VTYPGTLSLSRAHLNHLADLLRGHRARIGSRWRKLAPGRQALLVLAHLRNCEYEVVPFWHGGLTRCATGRVALSPNCRPSWSERCLTTPDRCTRVPIGALHRHRHSSDHVPGPASAITTDVDRRAA
jgi:hypothetical protein